jgi:4'-phosphopantetheinyl transferase
MNPQEKDPENPPLIPITSLMPEEIHLWLVFYDEIVDERLLRTYREMLCESEREQHPRFHFVGDRQRYLVTRALVRTVLSRYAPVRPEEWVFSTNEYGRPEIHAAQENEARLSFNISHTRGLIVLGVTAERELGVDVENVRALGTSIEIAKRFFAPEEVAALTALPVAQRLNRFWEYWTFKESYIKARSKGLSIPLDKFAVRYPHDRGVELAIHPDLADDPARWQLWQFRPTPDYLVAICAERRGDRSPRFVVKRVIPTAVEESLVVTFSRSSE